MKAYTDDTSLYRQEVPALSLLVSPGKVTNASIQTGDLQGFRNAMGITYLAPVTNPALHVDSEARSVLSIIYSPHGTLFSVLEPYVTFQLKKQRALPLSTIIHSVDRNDYPWWLGGNIITGAPGALEIIRHISVATWIACHDVKRNSMAGSFE